MNNVRPSVAQIHRVVGVPVASSSRPAGHGSMSDPLECPQEWPKPGPAGVLVLDGWCATVELRS